MTRTTHTDLSDAKTETPESPGSPRPQKRIASARAFAGADLLTLSTVSPVAVLELFETARAMKADLRPFRHTLDNKAVALLFEKPSLRTKVSFDVGIAKLGGHAIFMN